MNDAKTSVPVIPPVQQGAKAKAKPEKSKTSQKLAREEAIEDEGHECKLRKIRYAKKIMIREKKSSIAVLCWTFSEENKASP